MIIIPDIHINNKYWPAILHKLEEFFDKWDDKEVIFLWDYVYMFSYDRNMLMKLFQLMVRLYNQGRKVYMLAGNHDWLSGHFVYSEGSYAFDIINDMSQSIWLKFITKPMSVDKSDYNIFYLPHDPFVDMWWSDLNYDLDGLPNKDWLTSIKNKILLDLESTSTNQQASAKVNKVLLDRLLDHYANYPDKKLVVIHHYYILDTVFPWLQSKFDKHDIWLYPEWCDIYWLQLISGHIHHPFQYKNYLCCGAVRATSRWEMDDLRYLRRCDDNMTNRTAYDTHINLYMSLEYQNQPISKSDITNKLATITKQSEEYLSGDLDIGFSHREMDLQNISLILKSKSDITDKDNIFEDKLNHKLKEFVVKHDTMINEKIILEISSKQVQTSVEYTQSMLIEFLKQKYPQDHDRYIDYLKKLEIVK